MLLSPLLILVGTLVTVDSSSLFSCMRANGAEPEFSGLKRGLEGLAPVRVGRSGSKLLLGELVNAAVCHCRVA